MSRAYNSDQPWARGLAMRRAQEGELNGEHDTQAEPRWRTHRRTDTSTATTTNNRSTLLRSSQTQQQPCCRRPAGAQKPPQTADPSHHPPRLQIESPTLSSRKQQLNQRNSSNSGRSDVGTTQQPHTATGENDEAQTQIQISKTGEAERHHQHSTSTLGLHPCS